MLQQVFRWTDDAHAEAREMWKDGKSITDIAMFFCISRGNVAGHISRNRDDFHKRTVGKSVKPKVKKNGSVHSAWTDAKLDVAQRLWAEGMRSCEIADHFRVSTKAFLEMTRRHRWRFAKRQNQKARREKIDVDALFEEIEATSPYDGRRFTLSGQEPVRFASLKATQCKFPLSAPDEPCGPEMLCCGSQREMGLPYCAAHYAISRRPA